MNEKEYVIVMADGSYVRNYSNDNMYPIWYLEEDLNLADTFTYLGAETVFYFINDYSRKDPEIIKPLRIEEV